MAGNESPVHQIEIKHGESSRLFQVRELPPIVALRLSAKLLPVFVGLMGSVDVSAAKGAAPKLDPAGLTKFIGSVTPELLEELRSVYAGSCAVLRVDEKTGNEYWPELSEKLTFDRTFGGKIQFLYRWLIECTKINFSDFLGGLASVQSENDQSENTGASLQRSPST